MKGALVALLAVVAACGGETAQGGSPAPPYVPPTYRETASTTELAALPPTSVRMALDDTYVYVIDAGAGITRVPKTGGDVMVIQPPGSTRARSLAVDDTHVYWTTEDAVLRCPKAGGSVETVADRPGQEVALDATHVYWTTSVSVESRAKAGGDFDVLAQNGSWDEVTGLALDDDAVTFFTATSSEAGIRRVPKSGGDPVTVAREDELAVPLAEASGLLAWIGREQEGRWRAHARGPNGEATQDGFFPFPAAMGVRDGVVYYLVDHHPLAQPGESFTEIVAWTPTAAPRSLAIASVPAAYGTTPTMAVDAQRVYWIDAVGGGVPDRLRSTPR